MHALTAVPVNLLTVIKSDSSYMYCLLIGCPIKLVPVVELIISTTLISYYTRLLYMCTSYTFKHFIIIISTEYWIG